MQVTKKGDDNFLVINSEIANTKPQNKNKKIVENIDIQRIEDVVKEYNVFLSNSGLKGEEKAERATKLLEKTIEMLKSTSRATKEFENLYVIAQKIQEPLNKILNPKEQNEIEKAKKELQKNCGTFNHFLNEIRSDMKTNEEITIENALYTTGKYKNTVQKQIKNAEQYLLQIKEFREKGFEPKNILDLFSKIEKENPTSSEFAIELIKKISENLKALEEIIFLYESKEVPKEGNHIDHIATYTRNAPETVQNELSLKKEIYENIKVKHDELAQELINLLTLKATADWACLRTKTSCTNYAEMELLNSKLSILSNDIENLKRFIDEATKKNENERDGQLQQAELQLIELKKQYFLLDQQGTDLELRATKALELLTQEQNANGQGLDEEFKKIKFYNLELKKSVDNNIVECKKNLILEKNTLKDKLSVQLKNSTKLLQKTAVKHAIAYELGRVAAAIENKGVFRYDFLFGWTWSAPKDFSITPNFEEKK